MKGEQPPEIGSTDESATMETTEQRAGRTNRREPTPSTRR